MPADQETEDRRPRTPPLLATALAYSHGSDAAPRVVANGRGPLAERIRAVARDNGVAVVEDPDLAEVLNTLDLGSEIPVAAYAAVAEILVYLYRLNGGHASSASAPARDV